MLREFRPGSVEVSRPLSMLVPRMGFDVVSGEYEHQRLSYALQLSKTRGVGRLSPAKSAIRTGESSLSIRPNQRRVCFHQ